MQKIFIMFILLMVTHNTMAAASCGLKDTVAVTGHNGGNPQLERVLMRGNAWLSTAGSGASWQQVTIQLCLGEACNNKRVDRQIAQITTANAMGKSIWLYMYGLDSCNELLNYSPSHSVVQLEIR
jgi:hypothetical protein